MYLAIAVAHETLPFLRRPGEPDAGALLMIGQMRPLQDRHNQAS